VRSFQSLLGEQYNCCSTVTLPW